MGDFQLESLPGIRFYTHTHVVEQLRQVHMCYIQKARGRSLFSARPPNSGYSCVYHKCA